MGIARGDALGVQVPPLPPRGARLPRRPRSPGERRAERAGEGEKIPTTNRAHVTRLSERGPYGLHRNPVDVTQLAVADVANVLIIRRPIKARLECSAVSARAAEIQPASIGRDTRIELPRWCIDRARKWARPLPHPVPSLRNVQVIGADGIGAARRTEDQIAFVGSDPRLDLSSTRVDGVSEVLGRLIHTVNEPRTPDILVPSSARRPVAAEVEIAVHGNGRRPLVASRVVHRRVEMVRLSPRPGALPIGVPDIIGLSR